MSHVLQNPIKRNLHIMMSGKPDYSKESSTSAPIEGNSMMAYMAEDCIEMPLTLGSKHMNVAYIFSNFFVKDKPEDTQMKYQSYKIQGATVSKKETPEIECKEDEDGEIECMLPDQVISYKVEDLSTNK